MQTSSKGLAEYSHPSVKRDSQACRPSPKHGGGLVIKSEPMRLQNHLLREAGKLASSQIVRRVQLFAEISSFEGRGKLTDDENAELAKLREEAENCAQALPRFSGYRPHQDTPPNCPYCWIVSGEAVRLARELKKIHIIAGAANLNTPRYE
jgi:hypothetical protein